MLRILSYFQFVCLMFCLGCGQELDFNHILANEGDLEFKYIDNPDSTFLQTPIILKEASRENIMVRKWLESHSSNWKGSIVSWGGSKILILGAKFRLLVFEKRIVLGYESGKEYPQFVRKISEKDYDYFYRIYLATQRLLIDE